MKKKNYLDILSVIEANKKKETIRTFFRLMPFRNYGKIEKNGN